MKPAVKKSVILVVAIVAFGSIASLRFFREERRPSIVLLMIDTLRADKLGIYGSPAPASSEFDRRAETGVVFEQPISQASWTRSSIASMITGLYPHKAGVLKEKWDQLPTSATTLAERLKENGYHTIGLTANPQLNRDFQFEQGFDRYVESTVLFPWMQKQPGKVKVSKDHSVKTADEMLEEARRRVRERPADRPIYLQILLMDVHAHHRIDVANVDSDLANFPNAAYLQSVRNAMRPVAAFIDEMDRELGGDVIFVVTADHGEGLEDHPSVNASRGHGNLLYRSQIHVPLVFIGGSKRPFQPHRVRGTVPLVDLVPTLLSLLDIPVPGELDGTSLITALRGLTEVPNHPAFSETEWRPGVAKRALVDGAWLYVESKDQWRGTAPEELHPFHGSQNGASESVASEKPEETRRMRENLTRYTPARPRGEETSSNPSEPGVETES